MQKNRDAFSLLEVLAVVILLSVVALAATGGLGNAQMINLITSQSEDSQCIAAIRSARMLAISTSAPSRISFQGPLQNCTGCSITSAASGTTTTLEQIVFSAANMSVSASSSSITFDAAGNANNQATIRFSTTKPIREILVLPAGGVIHDVQL